MNDPNGSFSSFRTYLIKGLVAMVLSLVVAWEGWQYMEAQLARNNSITREEIIRLIADQAVLRERVKQATQMADEITKLKIEIAILRNLIKHDKSETLPTENDI